MYAFKRVGNLGMHALVRDPRRGAQFMVTLLVFRATMMGPHTMVVPHKRDLQQLALPPLHGNTGTNSQLNA